MLLACIPSPVPVGRTAMELWASGILDTFGLPNTPGYKQALYQMVLSTKTYLIPKVYFAIEMKKAESKQTAYMLQREIKEEQTNRANNNGTGTVQQVQEVQTSQ